MTSIREKVESALKTGAPLAGIAELIGFRLVSGGGGQMILELETEERHYNAVGTVHGGVLCDIADAAMGLAFATTLANDETFTTVELKINYLKPVWRTTLRAIGNVVKRGRTLGLVDCDIVDAQGSLVARASSTCMILRGDKAAGR